MKDYIDRHIRVFESMRDDAALQETFSAVLGGMEVCLHRGNKLLIAGNGGSAADAQHFAAEIVCRFKKERKAFPALALTTDSSILTAWGNDKSFDDIFARQVEAFGKPGDIFFGISTSGQSPNILFALEKAQSLGLITVGLLGNGGGDAKDLCRYALVVPSNDTAHIQEAHIALIHLLCGEFEKTLQ
jgi:D-sedoheptulose 7-phosphate isomerase